MAAAAAATDPTDLAPSDPAVVRLGWLTSGPANIMSLPLEPPSDVVLSVADLPSTQDPSMSLRRGGQAD